MQNCSETCLCENIVAAIVGPKSEVCFWSERAMPFILFLASPNFLAWPSAKKIFYQILDITDLDLMLTIIDLEHVFKVIFISIVLYRFVFVILDRASQLDRVQFHQTTE